MTRAFRHRSIDEAIAKHPLDSKLEEGVSTRSLVMMKMKIEKIDIKAAVEITVMIQVKVLNSRPKIE